MKEKKPAVKRKLPKKSKRAKRRYVLFRLKQGSCRTSKQAFDLVMGRFSLDGRKALGLWFIEFKPKTGSGIVRCKLTALSEVKRAIACIPASFEPKTMLVSGTLRKIRRK